MLMEPFIDTTLPLKPLRLVYYSKCCDIAIDLKYKKKEKPCNYHNCIAIIEFPLQNFVKKQHQYCLKTYFFSPDLVIFIFLGILLNKFYECYIT